MADMWQENSFKILSSLLKHSCALPCSFLGQLRQQVLRRWLQHVLDGRAAGGLSLEWLEWPVLKWPTQHVNDYQGGRTPFMAGIVPFEPWSTRIGFEHVAHMILGFNEAANGKPTPGLSHDAFMLLFLCTMVYVYVYIYICIYTYM